MVDILKCNTEELKALTIYKDVVEGDKRFPQYFWTNEQHQLIGIKAKCRILTRYCLENLAHLEPTDLPKYNLKQIKSVLIKGKLFGMVQIVFNHDVVEIMKNAYPDEFKSRVLKEWMWSKHGLWHNDDFIIEAVQDMVQKEGIRRIENIPALDWKQRLLDHGIYNVLSYFNFSIYALFNFVYPNKFHPTDFRYKIKWAASESLDNAFYFMHKTFKKNRYSIEDILMLSTSAFKRLGFAGMLLALFDGSALRAKEYYLYKTIDNEENIKEINNDIKEIIKKRRDATVVTKLKKVASGKYIYNLHSNYSLYNYLKRHAKKSNLTIGQFISSYGFVYKSAKDDIPEISPDEVWELRRQRYTYVQIADELGSNPTTIAEMCEKHFGGDPLIPRPLEHYITVQELMNKYRVDHKTVMKIVDENNLENHMTIRFRYLNKLEIEPALRKYVKSSKHHQIMVSRYQAE